MELLTTRTVCPGVREIETECVVLLMELEQAIDRAVGLQSLKPLQHHVISSFVTGKKHVCESSYQLWKVLLLRIITYLLYSTIY